MREFSVVDLQFMSAAFALAERAGLAGEIPVGAVVVYDGVIIGKGSNSKETDQDPWRLSACTLYVTLEPCGMCAGALVQARVDRVVYATRDPKTGAVHSLYQMLSDARLNHQIEVLEGVMAEESQALLKRFFAELREKKKTKPPPP